MGKGLTYSRRHAPERSDGLIRKVIRVTGKTFVVTDGAPGWGTVVIGDFPEGNIALFACVGYLKFTKGDANITATWTGNASIGSAPTADGTLSGSDVNIAPSTAISAATAGVSPVTRVASSATESGIMLDNTDGSLEINLNALVADASISGNSSLTADGYVIIVYHVLGDD